uniref:NADH dehydrogenase subunit 6 n=1 Tax=Hyalomma marginatum TaxID=34627 RepID=A0A889Q2Z4_9ACAR|nr:NADH dehydrogenase subunit 6 [Hyalomma marginatum]QRE78550.1 NADH dehydrogenase subunit 6 [Hyalomma marginatum]QRE78563.1 NADH dehydrogenase subunit 6 [Hyalomma marginatum]QRE78576.1 NADH dehydrogenase subunit 6 [Hyalomma marginatum]QRF92781.1 NADH dehydrogenase subunit 6 [Hyalomma marginatum]QRF92792.1 NADH dehydrogenase subunit 6 [Hyalomma marginatum]
MKMFLILSLICALFFHPIMMLLSLILFTLFLSIMFYNSFQFAFISLMMVLLILGGMLIIFMYMISLCPNSKMNLNIKLMITPFLLFFFVTNLNWEKFEFTMIYKIYMMNYLNMMIIMMFFLIMSLMIISKNLKWINAPIKKFI